jgi:hypothetical protein
MKPLFTIHEGEFLVGDYINRKLGRKFDVWVPSKDSGVDLLVTRKRREGKPVRLQVKFSRSFDIREDFVRHVVATSWFRLEPSKIRKSLADKLEREIRLCPEMKIFVKWMRRLKKQSWSSSQM